MMHVGVAGLGKMGSVNLAQEGMRRARARRTHVPEQSR